ncbi:dystrophin-like [Notothenia coriiceps]|uniref:Dystrophin-like n=1 Tax=Notothenia coriiceps TaxID=8208 RepID=A0A6I9Q0E4_9TELE|nr:PREDICTED: dystrophin-like [Notothenia coriiceps]
MANCAANCQHENIDSAEEEVARLASLQPQVDLLEKHMKELKEEKEGDEDPSAFLDADISAFKEHYRQVLEDLRARERQLQLVLESLPPARYKETIATLLAWLQQCEAKLSIPSTAVTEHPVMEQRLTDVQALQVALAEHQGEVDYLTSTVEQVFQKAPADISQKYRIEMDGIMARWKRLGTTLTDNAQKLQELMAKLLQFENDVKTLKKWMADVDVFLNEEWPALGDSEALEKQLEQCTALVNDIHTIQPSVNGINEVGLYLKKEAEPPYAVHIQKELDDLNAQWENVCKQAYAKKSALKGGLDKTMALRKEMQEMQEWINQAEEDYLERDFTYKTPEELRKAVEELKRAQEEVHSKELKVKLLTDSVNSFIAKAPPTAHDALRSELDVLTANYQRLCSRLDGKCKTLEEVWACWCELLSYLEQENAFLDQLEQKLDETENLEGGAEELQEALDSLDVLLQHPDDNRNQIRELAQTLMDGGVLDELIQQKLDAFNTRWDELMARDLRFQRNRKALAIAPQWYQYRRKSHDLLAWLDDIQRSVDQLPDPPEGERVKEIGSEFDKKKEELNEVQGLANQLSEAGAANLVEPRQLQLNTRWVEVEGKFLPFKRQCEYLIELQALLRSVSETDFKLNSPEYWPAAYYNLPQQDLCLKEVKASIEELRGPVEGALARREEMVSGARPLEGQRIQETASLLNTNWDKLNKLHQDRLKRWQDCNIKWQKFVSDQKAMEEWLNNAESSLRLAESEPAAHKQHLRCPPTLLTCP